MHIQNNGESKAFITGYNLRIDEFNYYSGNAKPKNYLHRRVEVSEGNPYLIGGSEPKFNTTDGSLEIDSLTSLDGVELPFFVEYADEHKELESITATVTLIHRPGKWNRRNFSFTTELIRR